MPVKQAFDLQTNTLWLSDAGQCADVPRPAAERVQAVAARECLNCRLTGRTLVFSLPPRPAEPLTGRQLGFGSVASRWTSFGASCSAG
jgi:hypothetical protein